MDAFRSESAYVLLGDPGSGKTTAFKHECEELGAAAVFLDAREFLAFDPGQHPGWQGKTLFIDGLDEVRAGSSDARTPLDRIRSRLDSLGRPPFRISCREADWLGENDRTRLGAVAPEATVTTLRLDPLKPSDIEQILGAHSGIADAQAFVERARELGVEALLTNPQTLNMLADVVGSQGDWPESRLETFEMACRQMATEHNDEHALASARPALEGLLDAAGYLCAAQLTTGAAGYSRQNGEAGPDFIALGDCDYPDSSVLDHALGTKLFGAVRSGLAPVHRHVAEFLAARYLDRRISEGLSARRVLALISGADGAVVTEMRGLSGWLAAHSSDARDLLIVRDPLGAALYGDLRDFSTDARTRLLHSLSRSESLSQLPREISWIEAAGVLQQLTAPDMEKEVVDLLATPRRDPGQKRLVQLVLLLLGSGPRRSHLIPTLLAMVRDATWPPEVGELALDAMLHATVEGDDLTGDLADVLDEIVDGSIADPNRQMRGALLLRLYPRRLGPDKVWAYLSSDGNANFIGRYERFWAQHLVAESSDSDVAELLDRLPEHLAEAVPALEALWATLLPFELLTRGLAAYGDDLPAPRLYNWLRSAVLSPWEQPDPRNRSVLQVHDWLEQRPQVQKAVILEGLARCRDSECFRLDVAMVWATLLGSRRPPDFGLWCLEQAVALAPIHPLAAEELLDCAYGGVVHRVYDRGLSLDVLVARIRGHEVLEKHFAVLREHSEQRDEGTALVAARARRADDQEKRGRDDGLAIVRSHAEALRTNQGPLGLLHDLGRAYFLYGTNWDSRRTPAERLSEFLSGDDDLIDAALAGLHGTMWRSDVPDMDEIIRLKRTSRMHYSALPFLAGLDILERESPERLAELTESQVRTGLAFFYCSAPGFNGLPDWHRVWVTLFPEVVADVAARCLVTAIRHGGGNAAALEAINVLEADPGLKHETTLRVLRRFPLRAGLNKLDVLDRLLWIALSHPHRSNLLKLIDAKLSRQSMGVAQQVRWLAAGFVAAPDVYAKRLDEFARGHERRVRSLAAFFGSGGSAVRIPLPSYEESAPALSTLIALMGRSFAPVEPTEPTMIEAASEKVEQLIRRLSALPGKDALQALDALATNPALARWNDRLERARDDQRVLHRDASYQHPDLKQFHHALADDQPANAGDLAALLLDRLSSIATMIRTGNTDDWRQYWNEDTYGRPLSPKHEDSCRDALLSQLRARLPDGVDAQPEGQYAGDRRSDIRASCTGLNVPVEIKKDAHRDVWSALRSQLIEHYTRDAEASGYGIYLVFWFGDGKLQAPPHGVRPATPAEMERRLTETLLAEDTGKIAVMVIDVSQPV
ncbi:MAG: hypothetical protein OXC71_09535 [Chloroflexi bacterium]|nr:hypothetical protein [Chloroflexota bacterium]